MIYCSEYNGVLFVEGPLEGARSLLPVSTKIVALSQGRSIVAVKSKLAEKARQASGNCVLNFTYGQRASWFLSGDRVSWYGEGVVAIVSDEIKGALLQNPRYRFPSSDVVG